MRTEQRQAYDYTFMTLTELQFASLEAIASSRTSEIDASSNLQFPISDQQLVTTGLVNGFVSEIITLTS